jgi:tripartite-type tricarboxylate transporter receptor subunit TctC
MRRSPEEDAAISRRACIGLPVFAALLALSARSLAQEVVTIVVPTPPGGPIDRVTRIVARAMEPALGQPVVVENKAGAAGKIGVLATLRATRNGRTLIAVSPSITSVNPVVDKAAGYDPLKDFDLLGIAAFNSGVVAVRAGLPVTSMAQLVAYAKARPNELSYASFGVGTSLHLQSEELLHTLGITARHVPYKGEAQAMDALIAGEVDMMTYVTMPIVPFVANGQVRALAATSSRRWAPLPDVPSFAETGIPQLSGYEYRSWVGLVMPAGSPGAERARIESALGDALSKPEVRKALEAQGFELANIRADEMRRVIAAELERNRRVIASGVSLD